MSAIRLYLSQIFYWVEGNANWQFQPLQIPACGFIAPGLQHSHSFQIINVTY